jgi:hypothetical protein
MRPSGTGDAMLAAASSPLLEEAVGYMFDLVSTMLTVPPQPVSKA